jgi:ribonuclease PH
MNLITKQQIDIDIASIEASATTFLNAVNAAIHSLNNSHQVFWNLPDDRLTAVLQKLHDNNQLLSLFANHEYSAKALNEIKSRANSEGVVAIAVAAREFEIVGGIVALKQPVVELEPTPDPEVIAPPEQEIIEPPLPDMSEPI